MTGWFNIVGLVGIVAVGRPTARRSSSTPLLGLYGLNVLGVDFGDSAHILSETWLLFFMILVAYTVVNIFADRFLALMNNVSVGWHLVGVAIVIGLLIFVPDHHQSLGFVFGERINNNGAFGGSTSGLGFWLLRAAGRIPADDVHADRLRRLGAHRRGDARRRDGRRAGRVALGVLVGRDRLVRAARVPVRGHRRRRRSTTAPAFVGTIFTSSLDPWAAKLVLLIATVGQLFCGAAGLTSASRTWYAFSRDRGMPGWWLFKRVNHASVPFNAVIGVSVASLVIAIPALFGKNNIPFAFFALTGICTVGLYLAYIIPVYLRLRTGDNFEPGPVDARAPLQAGQLARDRVRGPGRVQPRPAVRARRPALEQRLRRRDSSTTRRSRSCCR